MEKFAFFVKDFFEMADSLNISYEIISHNDSNTIVQKIYNKFFKKNTNPENKKNIILTWEELDNSKIEAAHLPFATSRNCPLLNISTSIDKGVYLMFEQNYHFGLVKFKNINDLSLVLDISYNFNYFIFDEDASYLFAWDAYETLFGGGRARKWVEEIKNSWLY